MESEDKDHKARGRLQLAFLLSPIVWGLGFAQSPEQGVQPEPTVEWTAAVIRPSADAHDGGASLELSAQILEGWHVYALMQPSGGPTALRITIDQNDFAQVAGAPTGTKPQKRHDPSFDLVTQIYTHTFAIRIPLRLLATEASGGHEIQVSVHYQSCSDRECLPPRTVRIPVPLDSRPVT